MPHQTITRRAEAKPGSDPSLRRWWEKRKETSIALVAGGGILLHLILRYGFGFSAAAWLPPLVVTLVAGGLPLLASLGGQLARFEFGSDLLAGFAIVTSALLGEYLVGAIVVLMLSGGRALEQHATRRASSVLDALAKRMPISAHRRTDAGLADVPLAEVQIGDRIIVLPHEVCPVDGVVVSGNGIVDESYLTGEPYAISKTPGSDVFSGTLNGDAALTIVASKLAVDSRYARIMAVMRETEQDRPRLRRIGDQLGAWYTPSALTVAALGWWWSGDPDRFLGVLVIATPCPLLIAIPVAVIGAISLAAKRSIIIKHPAALEQVDSCRTIIFDKTGTLTYGRPVLTDIRPAPGFTRDQALRAAASVERYSKHPLAGAILRAAAEAGLELQPVSHIQEKPGSGLLGVAGGTRVQITGRGKVAHLDLAPAEAGLECILLIDDVYAATFRFHDEPRRESGSFVHHLKPRHAVNRVMLVSGDREVEVCYLAQAVGIGEVHFGKSPIEKVEIVRKEAAREKTLFVGDGINDAPAMLAATVGVAFGQNSDITAEAADAVILEASLAKVDELIHIGRRMRRIALESALGGMILSVAGMFAAATGHLPPIAGAVAQELIDLAAVLNALRVAFPAENLTDF